MCLFCSKPAFLLLAELKLIAFSELDRFQLDTSQDQHEFLITELYALFLGI